MFLHLGFDVVVPIEDIVVIIGWAPKGTEKNKINKKFFRKEEKEGHIITIVEEKIKSLVITNKERHYLSPISKQTLAKRSIKKVFTGG